MSKSETNDKIYNTDELEAPSWLREKSLFKKILEKSEGPNIEVLDLKCSPATLKGDHYASVMFRFNVTYCDDSETKEKSLIVKTMPELDGHKQDILKDSHIFETEIGMYSEVLPKIESALKKVADNTIIAPRCLYHSLSPRKIIVFEDIVPLGFAVLHGRDINLEEVYEVYSKLAKYHAVSYKILSEEPSFLQNYRHGLFTMPNFIDHPLMVNGCKAFISMLETQPDLIKYKPYFEALDGNILEKCIEASHAYWKAPQSNGFFTLSHGDFHVRNMMFRHNKANHRLEDLLFIDFQLSHVCPIMYDVIYSSFQILTPDMRRHKIDEILYHYFTVFQATLRLLDFKGSIPTLIDFKKHLLDNRHWELFMLVSFLPMTYEVLYGEPDLERMLTDETYRRTLYLRKEFIDELRYLLPKYLHTGRLEKFE